MRQAHPPIQGPAMGLDSFTTPYTDTIAGHKLIRGPSLRQLMVGLSRLAQLAHNPVAVIWPSLSTDPLECSLECKISWARLSNIKQFHPMPINLLPLQTSPPVSRSW